MSATGRFLTFLKNFRKSKRGLLGVAILIIFVIVALGADFIAPFSPTGDTYLTGVYASPVLFRYLPGGANLSENVRPTENPGFNGPASLKEWNFNASWSLNELEPPAIIDYSKEEGNVMKGAIEIESTEAGQSSEYDATISKTFYYPYTGPPKRFIGYVALLPNGTQYAYIRVSVFLERVGEQRYELWSNTFTSNVSAWTVVDSIDSTWHSGPIFAKFNRTDPAAVVFSKPGDYSYGIQVFFLPQTGQQGKSSIYIDDLNIQLDGTAFGVLGTDYKGRDIFSTLVYGSRISLFVGVVTALVSVLIGLAVGLVAGYLGRVVDELMMRLTDMLLVLPTLPLLLVLIATLGASIWNIIFVIGVLGWMGFARTVRSQVLSLKERPFVEAAKAVGAGKFHIILRHILPNVVSLIYVTLALSVPGAILAEAALSWLGLFDPSVVSWGRMLHEAQIEPGGNRIWWWVVPPGLCIAVIAIAFVLLGYALDEVLNPRLRVRR